MSKNLIITREFSFDAAHHLTDYHGKCERPHGHTYRLEISVQGPLSKDGLVIDFLDVKKIVHERVLDLIDHTDLNERFKNPSAENIAVWIWQQLKDIGSHSRRSVKLIQVRLWEGEKTSVIYAGN